MNYNLYKMLKSLIRRFDMWKQFVTQLGEDDSKHWTVSITKAQQTLLISIHCCWWAGTTQTKRPKLFLKCFMAGDHKHLSCRMVGMSLNSSLNPWVTQGSICPSNHICSPASELDILAQQPLQSREGIANPLNYVQSIVCLHNAGSNIFQNAIII